MDNPVIQFEQIQSPISENKDVVCRYRVSSRYTPHRLDKVILCPIDYTSDLQLLNTWEFVTCRNSESKEYPFEGIAVFSCEKYGYLVLDHANAPGYQLRYIDREGASIGASNEFTIVLEAVESTTMGISYVFLSDELNSPEAELGQTDTTLGVTEERERELTPVEEPISKPELELEPESSSLNLSNPGLSLFPLNQINDLSDRADRAAEQAEFLSETLQELRENKHELERRYRQRQLECEAFQHQVTALEIKQKKSEVMCEALNKLSGVLCPEGAWDRVEDQIEDLVQAATKISEEFQPGVIEALKTENDRLKEEYQSLDAVVKMYTNQLILTNQEQAMTSEKMTQLSKENDFLKTYDDPPMTTKAPRRNSDNRPSYPPRARPKHVTCTGGPSTESIIMTEPARGTSSPSFATIDFLRNASIHPNTVLCPICGLRFDKKKTTVERTKHVDECIKKTSK